MITFNAPKLKNTKTQTINETEHYCWLFINFDYSFSKTNTIMLPLKRKTNTKGEIKFK